MRNGTTATTAVTTAVTTNGTAVTTSGTAMRIARTVAIGSVVRTAGGYAPGGGPWTRAGPQ